MPMQKPLKAVGLICLLLNKKLIFFLNIYFDQFSLYCLFANQKSGTRSKKKLA
jgi:hypothetical protein